MSDSRRDFLKIFGTGLTASLISNQLQLLENSISYFRSERMDVSEKFWKRVAEDFKFENGLLYFNNGSLGACPLPVRQATDAFRKTLDEYPSKYMWGGWRDEKEKTRSDVAELFSVEAEEIALIHNTTEGMNLIARSFDLEAGDEVILADHEHTSGSVCWKVFQENKGVKLVRPTLPMMPSHPDEIVEVYRKAITPKTKIISMCHIVNTNGMMLPVKEISEMAHEQGKLVAVDGAQSAGMIDIDLRDLGCDFYTASAHKWLFAPKGIGILYARKDKQEILKPLIVCRGYKDKSIRRLENYNTRNLPELLGLGAAIDYYNGIGKSKINQRTYDLKDYFRSRIEANPRLLLKTPAHDQTSAAIQVVEVEGKKASKIKKSLSSDYNIDCRSMSSFSLNSIRISLAIFCTKKKIDSLCRALSELS